MTDTLRERLERARQARLQQLTCQSDEVGAYVYDDMNEEGGPIFVGDSRGECEEFIRLQAADAAIAAIAAWASEPTQVERATKTACSIEDRHMMCSFPDCACKAFPRGVRAAIAALFGQPK